MRKDYDPVMADLARYQAQIDKESAWDEAVETHLLELQAECAITITDTTDGSAYPWIWRVTDAHGKLMEEDGAETEARAKQAAQTFLENTAESYVENAYEANNEPSEE